LAVFGRDVDEASEYEVMGAALLGAALSALVRMA
jgi:hypothetical protein